MAKELRGWLGKKSTNLFRTVVSKIKNAIDRQPLKIGEGIRIRRRLIVLVVLFRANWNFLSYISCVFNILLLAREQRNWVRFMYWVSSISYITKCKCNEAKIVHCLFCLYLKKYWMHRFLLNPKDLNNWKILKTRLVRLNSCIFHRENLRKTTNSHYF